MPENKLEKLKILLRGMESVLIAYSGGVDSTFLLKVAKDVLGDNVLAVTARSPTYPKREYLEAKKTTKIFEVRLLTILTDELSQLDFVHNPPNRCYHCKRELFTKLKEIARVHNIRWIVDGSNFDDLKDFRPGRKAAEEMGVRSPLCEAGLAKEEIRSLSKKLGLHTWDKPSLACLASRVPYGTLITQEILDRLDCAEEFLMSLGLRQIRVRHHGEIARIEIEPENIEKIIYHREEIVNTLKNLGYPYITLDLEGYRSGSLNEVLNR